MTKLTFFILTVCGLYSCRQPIDKRLVGHWVDSNHKTYKYTKYGRTNKYVLDTVNMVFLEGGKWVVYSDTFDLVFEENGYVYEAEAYKKREPEDTWYTFRILELTDSTINLELFGLFGIRDTVNLNRKE